MLIQGSSKSNKTQILLDNYLKLIDQGVCASEILVLVQNASKRTKFFEEVKKRTKKIFLENPKIYTFAGLAYNAVSDNWAQIENGINISGGVIFPNQTGLEISELLMKKAIIETGFSDYNSKVNLLHQLFRRYSLIVQNDLTPDDVKSRSMLLNESFGEDAKEALENFKRKTLEFRAFDYQRQLSIFSYVYKKTDYFKNIKYLFLDDADEITNAEFSFLSLLKDSLKDWFVAYDALGTSRMGFLNADMKIIEKLENLFDEKPKNLDNIPFTPINTVHSSKSNRLEMINEALRQIETLVKSGVNYNDISIVTPILDSALKFCLEEKFSKKQLQYISGSEKLVETPLVENVITILKLCTFEEKVDIMSFRSVLSGLLRIPLKYCMEVVSGYKNDGVISFSSIENELYSSKFETFKKVFEEASNKDLSLYEKALLVFNGFFEKDFLGQLEKFNFFLKQLCDFEKVFFKEKLNPKLQKIIITQLENSIISENPPNSLEVEEDKIIVATAQKIIDLGIKRKYQIRLDVTSGEWTKQDLGTLYNSWVFQSGWSEPEFTYEINLALGEQKTKRQLRKLSLLGDVIYSYSSLFDINGIENTGGIEQYFSTMKKQSTLNFNFTPREDQKPVLDYKNGQMAISAVPGAGKTTILLALIIKLLEKKINPENIFVLTYMDSAARNFKERIKKICPNLNSLPNISTIHGLALRILKENANYSKIGLSEDFEVCDDNLRQKIIRELLSKSGIEQEEFDKYEKAISALKLSFAKKLRPASTLEAKKFLKFYNNYNLSLKSQNLIDYDDMLLCSVQLLENNPDVAQYYSEICEYIIEDEAQDSSVIQQRLLVLLSSKHKNLIRCGDINQSITTTFTNADKEGFEKFIKESHSVTMTSSQRCSKEIFSLANRLIRFSSKNDSWKKAFFEIEMKEVRDKNPVCNNALTIKTFDEYPQERNFLIEEIRKIFCAQSDASVAILVRSNFQIAQYEEFLSSFGYNVITRSDCLDRQPVFNLVFSILKFCEYPWRNENVLQIIKTLSFQKILSFSQEEFEYVTELKKPFITTPTDLLPSAGLVQLAWDLNYWLENSMLAIDEAVLKIGGYYYRTEIEKANLHLISCMMKKLSYQYKTDLLEKLEEIAKKPSQYKFFDSQQDDAPKSGSVNIMTYHKSKGDEFDFVFLPELCEENLRLSLSSIKIKADLRFLEHIKALNPLYKSKNEDELKKFQIEENLRLLYVAFTRAKRGLFISCAYKYKKFSRLREFKPSILFDEFFNEKQVIK